MIPFRLRQRILRSLCPGQGSSPWKACHLEGDLCRLAQEPLTARKQKSTRPASPTFTCTPRGREPGLRWTSSRNTVAETVKPKRPAIPHEYTLQGAEQIRTAVRGFAGLCLTTRPRRRTGHRSRPLRDLRWTRDRRARPRDRRDLLALRRSHGVAARHVPVPAVPAQDRLLRRRNRRLPGRRRVISPRERAVHRDRDPLRSAKVPIPGYYGLELVVER